MMLFEIRHCSRVTFVFFFFFCLYLSRGWVDIIATDFIINVLYTVYIDDVIKQGWSAALDTRAMQQSSLMHR